MILVLLLIIMAIIIVINQKKNKKRKLQLIKVMYYINYILFNIALIDIVKGVFSVGSCFAVVYSAGN